MTAQEAFNRVYEWFIIEGNERAMGPPMRSYPGRGLCGCYELPDGRRCAIGILVPPGTIPAVMNTYHLTKLLEAMGDRLADLREAGEGFLYSLQRCHDAAKGTDDMRDRLRALAADYDLTIPRGTSIPAALRSLPELAASSRERNA